MLCRVMNQMRHDHVVYDVSGKPRLIPKGEARDVDLSESEIEYLHERALANCGPQIELAEQPEAEDAEAAADESVAPRKRGKRG